MQALILAAGLGKRLGKLTEKKTKGMIEVNGKTLLQHSLDILTPFEEIKRIIIVVGHAAQSVKTHIGHTYNGKQILYIENKDYYKTNNIYSLFVASNEFKEFDTILLESDLIFERRLIEKLIYSKQQNLVLLAPWQNGMEGTVVTLTENKEIIQFISKENFDYNHIDRYYKTVNIYKFSKEFIEKTYLPFLNAYCTAFGLDAYYENILGIIAFIKKTDLKASILENNEKWYEIDDLNDLDIAKTMFSYNAKTYTQRYGGFWRFPSLIDFCYLVNPYFPSPKMINEMQSNFVHLLAEYPSTLKIQNSLAANIFECDPEKFLVGNGASELITALLNAIDYEKIGIPKPTFQEYVTRVEPSKLFHFKSDNNDFSYRVNELIAFSEQVDTMILVNPDNPTGNFIPKQDLMQLIEFLYQKNKKIIIDESFVDFAELKTNHSLLEENLLEKFENLIVIKSIGKSYGVAGCRLGVLASGNKTLIHKISSNLPVWNINSIGEFFLQIMNRYKSDYKNSLDKIIQQRAFLFESLLKYPFIRPIPSAANYILCEIIAPYTSEFVINEAIKKDILIKDCSSKNGFDNGQFIRITVRDADDNHVLIAFFDSLFLEK